MTEKPQKMFRKKNLLRVVNNGAGKEIIVDDSTVLSELTHLTTLFLLYSQLAWAGVPQNTVLQCGQCCPINK